MNYYEKINFEMYSDLSLNLVSDAERALFEEMDTLFGSIPYYAGISIYMRVRLASLRLQFGEETKHTNAVGDAHIHHKREVKSSKSQEREERINDVTLGSV